MIFEDFSLFSIHLVFIKNFLMTPKLELVSLSYRVFFLCFRPLVDVYLFCRKLSVVKPSKV